MSGNFLGRLARWVSPVAATAVVAGVVGSAQAQLRVVAWNISNFDGVSGLDADIKTAVYGAFSGRTMAPDVMMTLEFINPTAVNNFLMNLNTAPGSPGDWAAAPFIDGADTDAGFFYRTSKAVYLGTTIVGYGSSDTNNQPRNTYRYDIRLVGYGNVPGASLACYAVHMKAQGGTNDVGRRLIEAQRIRDNAEGQNVINPDNGLPIPGTALPSGWNFLVGGDMNSQSSTESFYVEYTGSQANNTGRFFDPIKTPGSWNNNSVFRFVHTQDPAGSGGMDDRHDQILLSGSLIDGQGFDYLGNANLPYSTTTWNDPNHSYRAWGNDGTTCPTNSNCGPSLTITGNAMVGAAIAQSLVDLCSGAGHLPVLLDLRVPPQVTSTTTINFGTVPQGSTAQANLSVSNSGDVAKWTANGISPLSYTLAASAGFTAPGGSFNDAAGGAANSHIISMSTATPGPKSGTITIASNAPDQPTRIVTLTGTVSAPTCPVDWNLDGAVNPADIASFVNDWFASLSGGTLVGDFNGDLAVTPSDVAAFVSAWFTALSQGC